MNGMKCGQRIRDSVLPQVVTDRHLSAKTVAPEGNRHLRGVVWSGLNQDRHIQFCITKSIGYGAFITEVGKRNDDSVDAILVLAKEFGTTLGVIVSLDRAVLCLLGAENDRIHAGFLYSGNHFLAAGFCEMIREESSVPDDQAHCHFLTWHKLPFHPRRPCGQTTLRHRARISLCRSDR